MDCLLVKIDHTGSVGHVADSGINDRLVKLHPLIDQTCFEFIDVSNFDENADENLSAVIEYLLFNTATLFNHVAPSVELIMQM